MESIDSSMISRDSMAYTYIDPEELMRPREVAILEELVQEGAASSRGSSQI